MYFFTPLCRCITSFLFSEMVLSKVHQPCTSSFTLTLSKFDHGSRSLMPHRSMLKLKSLPLFFIALYKNHLSTPNIFAVVLPLLIFSKTIILQTIYLALTPSLFKAPTLWLKLLERFSMMWVPLIACIKHANLSGIKAWIFGASINFDQTFLLHCMSWGLISCITWARSFLAE